MSRFFWCSCGECSSTHLESTPLFILRQHVSYIKCIVVLHHNRRYLTLSLCVVCFKSAMSVVGTLDQVRLNERDRRVCSQPWVIILFRDLALSYVSVL